MGTATHARTSRAARHPASGPAHARASLHPAAADQLVLRADQLGRPRTEQFELSRVFAGTVLRYLLEILPQVGRELGQWRALAASIPDPQLRASAGEALSKRGNVEGAALFATLVLGAHRGAAVRALVAYQTAYNYLDALAELPSADPIANGRQLHQALLVALQPGTEHLAYYEHGSQHEHSPRNANTMQRADGGYLQAIVDACQEALGGLPSYALVAPAARAAAARIVDYQALNLSRAQGGHGALERWATETTPQSSGLAWWETAAASGSSLAVHALIAAAATSDLDPRDIAQIDHAYHPWIGALHSLLDSLVDRREDCDGGRICLLDHYPSTTSAASRLADLALRSKTACERLPGAHAHRVTVTAMASYYLSAPECDTAEGRTIAGELTGVLGRPLSVAIAMFRARRLLRALTGRRYT
jgi:tetraprenyl-beta-curcumene synthase